MIKYIITDYVHTVTGYMCLLPHQVTLVLYFHYKQQTTAASQHCPFKGLLVQAKHTHTPQPPAKGNGGGVGAE